MREHDWKDEGHDGVGNVIQRCRNGACTVRKIENCSMFWQRAKGGHWRDTEDEEMPECDGTGVSSEPK